MMNNRNLQVGDIVRHFKGNLYKIVAFGQHTEMDEQLVVYQSVNEPSKVWCRPLSMFMSKVDKTKYPDVEQEYRLEYVGNVSSELVNHPAHYNAPGRKECIEEMIDIWGREQTAIWCEMTAYKYDYRAGTKEGEPDERDMAKRKWYLDKAKELRTEPHENRPVAASAAMEVAMPAAAPIAAPTLAEAAKQAIANDIEKALHGDLYAGMFGA